MLSFWTVKTGTICLPTNIDQDVVQRAEIRDGLYRIGTIGNPASDTHTNMQNVASIWLRYFFLFFFYCSPVLAKLFFFKFAAYCFAVSENTPHVYSRWQEYHRGVTPTKIDYANRSLKNIFSTSKC